MFVLFFRRKSAVERNSFDASPNTMVGIVDLRQAI
jgi:hypothetical protein